MKRAISVILSVLCMFSLCFSSYAAQVENSYDVSDGSRIGYTQIQTIKTYQKKNNLPRKQHKSYPTVTYLFPIYQAALFRLQKLIPLMLQILDRKKQLVRCCMCTANPQFTPFCKRCFHSFAKSKHYRCKAWHLLIGRRFIGQNSTGSERISINLWIYQPYLFYCQFSR